MPPFCLSPTLMNRRHLIAVGIADALLAGAPDAASARLRCERALGSRANWIGRLAREMVALFSKDWRDIARHRMARAIAESRAFDRARHTSQSLQLRNFPVAPAKMAPMPPALLDCVVPALPTPGDVARWLDRSMDELVWLTGPLERPLGHAQPANHYSYRWLPKRTGGVRLLEIPKTHLRAIQRRLLHELLEYVPPHEAAHGFRERHSCVTNARRHVGQPIVLRMDLADFFGSIGGGKVCALFTTLGYPAASARALTRLTTCATPSHAWPVALIQGIDGSPPVHDWHARKHLAAPHLPQGAPTSPALANLCAFNFDVRVQALADQFGVHYTRYADDLTFSGGENLAHHSRTFETPVAAIAIEEGFSINHRKTHLAREAARQRVTGIIVNRTLNIQRRDYDRLKAILHNCLRQGPDTQSTSGASHFRNHIAGHIANVSAIHPARGSRLKRMFDRVQWADTALS